MLERYEGKAFLKFVDLFVMDCIEALDASQLAELDRLTPNLQEAFGRTGTWQEIVMAQLGYEPGVRDTIRDLWIKNHASARQHGVSLDPMAFVHMFVDTHINKN